MKTRQDNPFKNIYNPILGEEVETRQDKIINEIIKKNNKQK